MVDNIDSSGTTLDAFLTQMQQHSRAVHSAVEASQISRGVRAMLAVSVSGGQLADLTAALPPELRSELDNGSGQAAALDKHTFLDQVSRHSGSTNIEVAEEQVRAVLSTVAGREPSGEIDNTFAQFGAHTSRRCEYPSRTGAAAEGWSQ